MVQIVDHIGQEMILVAQMGGLRRYDKMQTHLKDQKGRYQTYISKLFSLPSFSNPNILNFGHGFYFNFTNIGAP